MRITATEINKILELHLHRTHAPGTTSCHNLGRPDQLTISRQANEMQHIRQAISLMPDVRADKVKAFRAAVLENSYDVSNKELASAMFARAMENRG